MTERQKYSELPEEIEVDLTPAHLSPRKNIVRGFYKELWDKADLSLVPQIFHRDFTFRGSLGPVLTGHQQFSDYVSWLTETLEDYTSDILELVEEGDRVSGKLRFHGIQRRTLFGELPTNVRIWWYGAPIFTFDGPLVRDLWVLGDVYGLRSRLDPAWSERLNFSRADGASS
ncbi:MAG: ester cyclase [Rhodospirillales bacterium]|nr:ester cyclase [Rhodospirillales bacterium]